MRITETLLVQSITTEQLVLMDESAGTEIIIPTEAADRLIAAINYFTRKVPIDLPESVFPAAPPWEATAPLWDEPEPTRVRINPNLRLDDTLTMVDLDEDVSGEAPRVGQQVEVYTGEPLNWTGTGRITMIDRGSRTVSLAVDWPSLEKGGY